VIEAANNFGRFTAITAAVAVVLLASVL